MALTVYETEISGGAMALCLARSFPDRMIWVRVLACFVLGQDSLLLQHLCLLRTLMVTGDLNLRGVTLLWTYSITVTIMISFI